jgi:hypothetical protein
MAASSLASMIFNGSERRQKLMSTSRTRRSPFRIALLLGLLLTCLSLDAKAQVPAWVNSTNAVEVFTNLSTRLLAAGGYSFDAGNIPVYMDGAFVFSPDVHRVLQVAANLYDATTNRADRGGQDAPYLPSVFRPIFKVTDGSVFICGWTEEISGTNWMNAPRLLNSPADAATINPNDNLYDVPWIIGAKKGFPNFNEFALDSVAQISRKLQLTKPSVMARPNTTNQMFIVGISNQFAFEAWNSYPSNYARAVDVIVVNDMSVGLCFTNDPVFDPRGGQTLSRYFQSCTLHIPAGAWAGYGSSLTPPNHASFVVPLATNIVFLPASIYRSDSGLSPYFTSDLLDGQNLLYGFEQTRNFPLPQFMLAVTNHIRFVLLDSETQRVIDYLILSDLGAVRNLSLELSSLAWDSTEQALWSTNRVGGDSLGSPPGGIIAQVLVALGQISVPNDWNYYGLPTPFGDARDKAIDSFRVFCGLSPYRYPGLVNTNLVTQAPFTPSRATWQHISWQANDPLVHFLRQDLEAIQADEGLRRLNPNVQVIEVLRNIGQLNDRFQPWRGNPGSGPPAQPPPYATTIKDPRIRSSADWDLGPFGPLDVSWLGRVHRGTPWQTLYLKSSDVSASTWMDWLGSWDSDSALRSRPVSDHALIGSLVTLLNTNTPASLISPNSPDRNQWLAALDGLVVLTNAASDEELQTNSGLPRFETNIMSAASIQASVIADAIIQARGSSVWSGPGDLLQTPALSDSSPWLNLGSVYQQVLGITDDAYETIAAQLLPRVRMDSLGTVAQSETGATVAFTGYDGFAYRVETSTNLINWRSISTNIPSNGVFRFAVSNGMSSVPQFYRTVVMP